MYVNKKRLWKCIQVKFEFKILVSTFNGKIFWKKLFDLILFTFYALDVF